MCKVPINNSFSIQRPVFISMMFRFGIITNALLTQILLHINIEVKLGNFICKQLYIRFVDKLLNSDKYIKRDGEERIKAALLRKLCMSGFISVLSEKN